jgi:hypothetical protein
MVEPASESNRKDGAFWITELGDFWRFAENDVWQNGISLAKVQLPSRRGRFSWHERPNDYKFSRRDGRGDASLEPPDRRLEWLVSEDPRNWLNNYDCSSSRPRSFLRISIGRARKSSMTPRPPATPPRELSNGVRCRIEPLPIGLLAIALYAQVVSSRSREELG